MTALIVAAAVAAVLALVCLVKCRVEAGYDEGGFRWRVSVGLFTLAPHERRESMRKNKKSPPKKPEQNAHELPSLGALRDLAELALRLLKRFFKRLRIEWLRVYFVSAFDDPYDTAMAYGYAGEAMETVTALSNGRIRKLELHTELDFDAAQPQIEAGVTLSVRLGALLAIAISALFGFLSLKRRWKKQSEKENEHGKSVDR